MLTAIFVRHGEADYDCDGLTENGRAQVRQLADVLKENFLACADFEMHVSSAGRTRESGGVLFDQSVGQSPIITDGLLFRARANYVQGGGEYMPQSAQNLLLVSHAGQIEANVHQLCGEDIFQNRIPGLAIPKGREHLEADLKTAEAVVLSFDGESWGNRGAHNIEILRNTPNLQPD